MLIMIYHFCILAGGGDSKSKRRPYRRDTTSISSTSGEILFWKQFWKQIWKQFWNKFFFCNWGDTIQYHGGLGLRELGQAPVLLMFYLLGRRYHLTHTSLLWFCGSPWILIQLNNFFKLLAPGSKLLTLRLQVQHSTSKPRGLPITVVISWATDKMTSIFTQNNKFWVKMVVSLSVVQFITKHLFKDMQQIVCNVCYEKFVTHLLLYTVVKVWRIFRNRRYLLNLDRNEST